jgi:membrane associated rhomboid family serine protease
MSYPSTPGAAAQTPACYRHPDRATYVRCNRCQRYICPDCMRSAAVGHQCVDCVREGSASVPEPRTQFGAKMRGGSAPIVTWTLIAVNVAMFIVQMAAGDVERQLTLWPVGVAAGEYYRLATSAFLHADVMHILFNMWALYVIGPQLEAWLGRLRFGLLYAMSALGGSVLVYLLSPVNVPTLGASGAIFGLFGATFVVARRLNLDVRWVIGLIVVNLVITFVVPSISWQGHVGGLVTGALIGAALAYAPRGHRNTVLASVIIVMLGVFAALVVWRTRAILDTFGGSIILG